MSTVGEDKPLRDAVKIARSNFYQHKIKKKKFTRKEIRKNKRLDKKNKQHDFQMKKNEKAEDKPFEEIRKKKRKRKKRKNFDKQLDIEEEGTEEEQNDQAMVNKKDDQIINQLGKKLQINKKNKLPSIFCDDGLDYLLEVCEPLTNSQCENDSDEEYLLAKKSNPSKKMKTELRDQSQLYCGESSQNISFKLLFDDGITQNNIDNKGSSIDLVEDIDNLNNLKRKKEKEHASEDEDEKIENRNKADVFPGKYIPPSLRNVPKHHTDKEQNNKERIKRQLKGLLNRVSEATLPAIISDIDMLYVKNSRNNMNEVLFALIAEACISESKMTERLIIEHILIIAALHTSVGVEVGSYALEMLAQRFHLIHHKKNLALNTSKELYNIVLMFANLYILKVVHCGLIYDIFQCFLHQFQETDIEMILELLKTCGGEIRRDDPATLKEIICEIQSKAANSDLKHLSRVAFMLEIINALKNNNLQKIPRYDVSLIETMKKNLKQISLGKGLTSGIQLKVSLLDLLDVKEKGRWWIVGSAWSGNGPSSSVPSSQTKVVPGEVTYIDKLLDVAKKQRMNSNLKKNIFCTIMASEDYVDAFERLLKLNLKEKQSREIIHVLVDCCLQEKLYNPFYAHLSDKFCEYSKSYQITLQYCFWDRFKVLSTLNKHSSANLSKLVAHSVASQSITLSVLKIVSFGVLDKASVRFFIRFFNTLLQDYPESTIIKRFQSLSKNPKLSLLCEGIKVFLKHFLLPISKEDVNINSKTELIEKCEAAIDGREYAFIRL